MNDDWNRGYEKGRDDYCCNGNCNQGRDCPLRKPKVKETETIRQQQIEIDALKHQIKHLESQVYGGTTK